MSDGSHDDPYACLRPPPRVVKATPNDKGTWFKCSECKEDMPPSAWAAAHLMEGLRCNCPCGVTVALPTKLPKVKKDGRKQNSKH